MRWLLRWRGADVISPLLLLLLLPEPVRWCAVEWCGVVCCVCCSGPVQALDV